MDAVENQDRGVEVAAWVDGERVGTARPGESVEACRYRVAHLLRINEYRIEVLKACVDHPQTPAVDCTICAPLD